MTRLAIISDVHADVHALQDALVQVARLGCDAIVCAGDLVDYGLFPAETVSLLMERRIPCVRGNHDRWAVGQGHASDPHARGTGAARDATGWDLSPEVVRFLAELPTGWDATLDGVRVAVRHGSPRSDMDGLYPDALDGSQAEAYLTKCLAQVLVVGHTHIPFSVEAANGIIVNPGALLRDAAAPLGDDAWLLDPTTGKFSPAPRPGGGTFGVLELPERRFTVHRAADGAEVEIVRRNLAFRVVDRRSGRE